jgi:hypothetical protein
MLSQECRIMGRIFQWTVSLVISANALVWAQDPPATTGQHPLQSPNEAASPPVGVAVVELFTSQGCSSCPPADELLTRLAELAPDHADRLFPLAFHVDIWDYLGWADPYASPHATRRHRAYTRFLLGNLEDPKAPRPTPYTPAMVVNGRRMFVGSDEANAKASIKEALESPVLVSVSGAIDHATLPARAGEAPSAWLLNPEDPAIAVDVSVRAIDQQLWPASIEADKIVAIVALVENGLSTEVNDGENAGKTLAGTSVVRAFAVERVVMVPTMPKDQPDKIEGGIAGGGAEGIAEGGIAGGSISTTRPTNPALDGSALESRVRMTLKLPPSEGGLRRPPVNLTKASVVVFVADEKDWRVMGAGRSAIESNP